MMKQIKTLLVLGSNVGSTDIITYARKGGANIIVADYYDIRKSKAKQLADEEYMISTSDIDLLEKLILDRKVDAIIAGISEFNLLQAMKLSKMSGLKFYCDHGQWCSIEQKDLFRNLCEEHQVPCPDTYYTGDSFPHEVITNFIYPVVLKPVDANSSIGVHICMNEEEVAAHFNESLRFSSIGKVIIEEYAKGEEFTAHYTIFNGSAALSCVDNRYPISLHSGNVTTIPIARIYPSTFTTNYIAKVNAPMIKLCESIGLANGVLFV